MTGGSEDITKARKRFQSTYQRLAGNRVSHDDVEGHQQGASRSQGVGRQGVQDESVEVLAAVSVGKQGREQVAVCTQNVSSATGEGEGE